MLARVQRLSTWCLENISLFPRLHILYFQVAWIHIDRQMILTIHRHVISRVPRFSVSHDNAKTWLLHVSSVQKEDRGYYMCQVNTNPMISQVGYLQVVGKSPPQKRHTAFLRLIKLRFAREYFFHKSIFAFFRRRVSGHIDPNNLINPWL